MKSRGACSGRHLEESEVPVPSGCMITIPEVPPFSESIIPQAERDRLCAILPRNNTGKIPGSEDLGYNIRSEGGCCSPPLRRQGLDVSATDLPAESWCRFWRRGT